MRETLPSSGLYPDKSCFDYTSLERADRADRSLRLWGARSALTQEIPQIRLLKAVTHCVPF
jgi:hypothetical protein